MNYEISLDASRVQLDVVHAFLCTCYWSPGIRREVVGRAVAGSLVCGAYSAADGTQVGFARVVSDRATFAWLCDVFVLPDHRGHGLSKRMVAALLEHPDLHTLRRWCLATRDAHGLYRRFGFSPVPAERWMELLPPNDRWQTALADPRP